MTADMHRAGGIGTVRGLTAGKALELVKGALAPEDIE